MSEFRACLIIKTFAVAKGIGEVLFRYMGIEVYGIIVSRASNQDGTIGVFLTDGLYGGVV